MSNRNLNSEEFASVTSIRPGAGVPEYPPEQFKRRKGRPPFSDASEEPRRPYERMYAPSSQAQRGYPSEQEMHRQLGREPETTFALHRYKAINDPDYGPMEEEVVPAFRKDRDTNKWEREQF